MRFSRSSGEFSGNTVSRSSFDGSHLAPARRLPGKRLSRDFFSRNTLDVARDLLGAYLCRREEDGYTVGTIVETEAYRGEDDPACHAAAGRTPRTRVLYGPPGRAYVYFNYGMHYLLNAVTESEDFPGAVLIRALRPERGVERMLSRRRIRRDRDLTSGPARLCQALGVDLRLNDVPLDGPDLHIRENPGSVRRCRSGPRIGIRVGTRRPWRFWVDGDPFVSRR